MTKDELIELLEASPLPGDAPVFFHYEPEGEPEADATPEDPESEEGTAANDDDDGDDFEITALEEVDGEIFLLSEED